jgi:hypothetical protein
VPYIFLFKSQHLLTSGISLNDSIFLCGLSIALLGTHLFYEILGLPKLMVLGFPFTRVIIRCRCCEVFFRHGVTRGHADGLRVGHKDHHSWLKAKKAMCKNFGKQRCTSYLQLKAGTFCCPYHETIFYMRRFPKYTFILAT